MGVPRTYRKSQEKAIASYDYTDIASAEGVINFYPYQVYDGDNSQILNKLNNLIKRSRTIEILEVTGGAGSQNITCDLSEFNLPRSIEGTAYANGTSAVFYVSGSTPTKTITITIKFQKWDGSTATDIADNKAEDWEPTADSSTQTFNWIIPITIPRTHFKKGETLRIIISTSWTVSGGGVWGYGVGLDPYNRDGTYITPSTDDVVTKTELSVPFKIDL